MGCQGINDKELWIACQQGDERAYGELMAPHVPKMVRIASRYTKDSMKAEEIVMDCFFKLWTKRKQILDHNFLNYLFRCVRNGVISNYRKEIRITIGYDQVENSIQEIIRPDSCLLADDIRRTCRVALRDMPPRARQAFLLSREENLSYAEIAQRMNISVGVVQNYMTSALDDLRVRMKTCLPFLILVSILF